MPRDNAGAVLTQGVEDRRIHALLSDTVTGWDALYAPAIEQSCDTIPVPENRFEAVALDLCSRQTEGKSLFELPDNLRAIADDVERMILRRRNDPGVLADAVQYALERLSGDEEQEEQEEPDPGESEPGEGNGDGESGESDDQAESESGDSEPPKEPSGNELVQKQRKQNEIRREQQVAKPQQVLGGMPPTVDKGYDEWGDMTIVKPPLSVAIPRKSVDTRSYRSTKEGTVPRHLHRAASSGRVFVAKKKSRRPGGTVLLDASGSMSITDEDIRHLVTLVRHGDVAMYSGSGTAGDLFILASNYRRVDKIPYHDGGNIIDGPALMWLARQPKPRIWISDGGVSGCHDSFSMRFDDQAEAIVKRYGIERYDRISEYLRDAK
jgi:hypothetical protein